MPRFLMPVGAEQRHSEIRPRTGHGRVITKGCAELGLGPGKVVFVHEDRAESAMRFRITVRNAQSGFEFRRRPRGLAELEQLGTVIEVSFCALGSGADGGCKQSLLRAPVTISRNRSHSADR